MFLSVNYAIRVHNTILALWDLFLSAPCANSVISITIRTCTHTNVSSQVIIYPNPNLNQKNLKFGARNSNPFFRTMTDDRDGGRRPYKKGKGF